ncbi:DNA polymerase III subunit delta [bacterium]|nr:DNA polymerase III subunit delta [bacterium]
MNFPTFRQMVQKDKIRPAYFFLGEEDFLAESGAAILTDKLLTPTEKSMNLSVFYGSEAISLPEALNTMPVFGGYKVTIVRHAQELNAKNQEAVIDYLKNPPNDGCLILLSRKVDKRKFLFKNLNKNIETVECDKPRFQRLNAWIKEYVAQWNKKLDNEALGKLTAINWPGLRELAGELDRLTLQVGDAEIITVKDIEDQGGGSYLFERWALSDAVAVGDLKKALISLENLHFWNTKPMQIINDLFKLFNGLWIVKYYIQHNKVVEGKQESGLHQFVYKKYTDYSRAIPRKVIEDGLLRLVEADLNIKRGIRQPAIELNMLVVDLTRAIGKRNI